MTLGDYIKNYRTSHKCSMDEFAKRTGLSKAYVSILERNFNPSTGKAAIPSLETVKRVSLATNVDFNDLIAALDNDQEIMIHANPKGATIPAGFNAVPESSRVPRVGRIACGKPITAEENVEGYDEVLSSWHADFTLICCGDSMLPKIEDGDIVAIRCQPTVENGEIAAVRIGDEATLKQVFIHPDFVELRPLNSNFESIIKKKEEMDDIHIEGKAVGLCRNL